MQSWGGAPGWYDAGPLVLLRRRGAAVLVGQQRVIDAVVRSSAEYLND
ncbi:hypothetical protein [Verrucomicrobium spinosum]|nr:hypothetical protein [Verrucomicrobium spinosum]